jgi:hypothetical protein
MWTRWLGADTKGRWEGEGWGEGSLAAWSCLAALMPSLSRREGRHEGHYPGVEAFVPRLATLIHTAIDLQAVTAAIDNVDQALGVELDRGRAPQKALDFAILGGLALLHVIRVGW